MSIPLTTWSAHNPSAEMESFLRRPAFDAAAEETASRVLAAIREEGDAAVLAAAERFDKVVLKPSEMRLTESQIEAAARSVPPAVRRAVKEAHRRVRLFARAGMRKDWSMRTRHGGLLGERFVPLDRVGVYIPGGAAPLVSTAVMTVTLGQVAGVREIVACTPCDRGKRVAPALLHALQLAGATEVYRLGGIQAVGMMAFGTQSVRPVQKIVGPGGAHVTAAKRQVYGRVALDLVAGPSEIAILADAGAKAAWIAADLLSQLEHGTGREKALLVTDSAELAQAVAAGLEAQLAGLPRAGLVRPALGEGLKLVVVPDLDQGIELCNRFAPEHLEVMTARPRRLLPRLTAAGAIFVGPWTPEAVGDFAAGPSHVLPTGGAARMFSGLTADDFRRRTSLVEYTREDLLEALPVIEAFGAVEGLEAHSRSAAMRRDG
jgi:histidinol dehydrogenase